MEHVFARLKELGIDEVQRMRDSGELPTNWNPHIRDWLAMKAKSAQEKPGTPNWSDAKLRRNNMLPK